jgi:SNF2 family DNA or RNA helicase
MDVYYYDLVCEDTIEEVILKFLKQRQNVIKNCMDITKK